MTNKTLTYIDSSVVVENMPKANWEQHCALDTSDAEVLALLYKGKAVMFAGVYNTSENNIAVHIATILNSDLDVDTQENIVATLPEAALLIHSAFAQKEYQIISQY